MPLTPNILTVDGYPRMTQNLAADAVRTRIRHRWERRRAATASPPVVTVHKGGHSRFSGVRRIAPADEVQKMIERPALARIRHAYIERNSR